MHMYPAANPASGRERLHSLFLGGIGIEDPMHTHQFEYTAPCFDMPRSFKSPPLAFSLRRQEMKAPRPELSTKRNRLSSKTNLVVASSNGVT
jgi:hypothetical protein